MITPTMRIAVLVPCFNEEAAVATVISDFRKALPSADIFVYDNNSADRGEGRRGCRPRSCRWA
jgi:glycosyltransferase involved in cell wall biosynthesis